MSDQPQPHLFTALQLYPDGISEDVPGSFVAPSGYPDWYTPSKVRKTANANVLKGRHPLGSPLGPASATCRDCAHRTPEPFVNVYYKCSLFRRTRGAASDCLESWRSCAMFERGRVGRRRNTAATTQACWVVFWEWRTMSSAMMPGAADVRVAIDKLLESGGAVPGLDEWHHAKGMVTYG